MNLTYVKKLGNFASRKSPTILMITSIVGLGITVGMGIKDTPKALRLIDDEKVKISVDYNKKHLDNPCLWDDVELSKWETFRAAWTAYIPTIIMFGATVASIVGGNVINSKRNAAIASAYFLSETALKEYQAKVIKTIGEQKAKLIKDEIAQDRVTKAGKKEGTVIITGNGNALCFDMTSGRPFRSSINKIKDAEHEINNALLTDTWLSLNEIYGYLDLEPTTAGNSIGWDINKSGLLKFEFGSCISEDGEPCITFNFETTPRPKY